MFTKFTYINILIWGSLAFWLAGVFTQPEGQTWITWFFLATYWLILAAVHIGREIFRKLDNIEKKNK